MAAKKAAKGAGKKKTTARKKKSPPASGGKAKKKPAAGTKTPAKKRPAKKPRMRKDTPDGGTPKWAQVTGGPLWARGAGRKKPKGRIKPRAVKLLRKVRDE